MPIEDAQELREVLSQEDLGPDDAGPLLHGVRDAVKDALVHALATGAAPAPNGLLIARLAFLRTAANASEVAQVYRANVASPDPGARRASLYGLDELAPSEAVAGARQAVADPDPQVVAAATDILLRREGDAAEVRALLADVSQSHGADPAFRGALALLQAHGIGSGPLPGDVA